MDVLDKVLEVFISDKAHELGEKVNAGLRDEFCNTIREKTRDKLLRKSSSTIQTKSLHRQKRR